MYHDFLLGGRPYSTYILLTLKCNSECKHCFFEAGPNRKESMPMDLRKKVVDEMSKNEIIDMRLGGGEPIVEREELFETLNYILSVNKKTGYPQKVSLETNAYFLRGLEENEICKQLEMLKSSGLTDLHIASKDEYHNIEISELERIELIAQKYFTDHIIVWGASNGVHPIGRALTEVPKDKWIKRRYTDCDLTHNYIQVMVDGSVTFCSGQFKSLGNLADESLERILQRARGTENLNLITKLMVNNGFAKLNPEDLGISKEEYDCLLEEFGECGACYKYFSQRK